jgi:lysophospholipase L1-like esterase
VLRSGRGVVLLVALATAMTASPASASVLVVGDSLGVGTEPSLRAALPGLAVDADSRNGRTSPEGVAVLQERLRPEHDTVVFDLGTNDGPTAVGLTAGSLAAARELAGGRCLVVATLNHPPRGGASIDAQNASIRRFVAETPGAALVDWHAAAQSSRGLLRPDGVHATAAGYALRGQLFAEAIQSCLTGGGVSGGGGRGALAAPSGRASATKRPAERRSRHRERPGPRLEARLLEAVGGSLAREGGPVDLAAKAGATVAAAAATLRASLTPRGPEPVLGAPD